MIGLIVGLCMGLAIVLVCVVASLLIVRLWPHQFHYPAGGMRQKKEDQ